METSANLNEELIKSESRTLQIVELGILVRSLLDVANDLEFKAYETS